MLEDYFATDSDISVTEFCLGYWQALDDFQETPDPEV
jgi:hypothetical protein